MSGRPRFSLFRPWVEPSPLKKTNGDRLGLLPLTDGADREERKANVKHAWFFTTVAVLFILADQVGHVKNVSHSNSGLASAEHVSLALSPKIVTRTSPSSEWISPATVSKQPISAVPGLVDTNPTWIEMPPGGWVDGEFQDLGESPRDQAYVIYVKLAPDANSIRIISNSYYSLAIRGR